jgi:multiple sugar transport system permease protein
MRAARAWSGLRWMLVGTYALLAVAPLLLLALTSFKAPADATALDLKVLPVSSSTSVHAFVPTTAAYAGLAETGIGAASSFWSHFLNSAVIGLCSTIAAVALGTTCAYGFSRFRIAGAKDWLFFILSTRFMPPLAVVAPILVMYRQVDLQNSHIGLILLYTVFNLSLAVWLMKGFIDEIPKAFEEAALVDGYSRLQAFMRIIVPQARTGMAVTAVFCLIAAWNEYGFALTLNNQRGVTVPVFFAGLQGNINGVPWPQVAAGVLVSVLPIVVFTLLIRRHLLRGVTFGTIKQ